MTPRKFDLHRYHPRTVQEAGLVEHLVQQAWEMGESALTLIHGHGLERPTPRPFANTNTGFLGLTVRHVLRHGRTLRQWMYAKFDVSHPGTTSIRLKPNPAPTRTEFEGLPGTDF